LIFAVISGRKFVIVIGNSAILTSLHAAGAGTAQMKDVPMNTEAASNPGGCSIPKRLSPMATPAILHPGRRPGQSSDFADRTWV